MNNRTMATVYVDQDSISVKTRSRKGCSPQRFIILKKELQRLEEKKYLITKDIHSYVELRICDAVGNVTKLAPSEKVKIGTRTAHSATEQRLCAVFLKKGMTRKRIEKSAKKSYSKRINYATL